MTTDPHGPTADLATQGAADLLIRLGSGERTSAAVVSDLLERIAAVEAGRDPAAIEMLAGCPALLPGSTAHEHSHHRRNHSQGAHQRHQSV